MPTVVYDPEHFRKGGKTYTALDTLLDAHLSKAVEELEEAKETAYQMLIKAAQGRNIDEIRDVLELIENVETTQKSIEDRWQ